MIKRVAIILNFSLILILPWILFEDGFPTKPETILILLTVVFTLITNLIAILRYGDEDDLFDLWVKARKKKSRDRIND